MMGDPSALSVFLTSLVICLLGIYGLHQANVVDQRTVKFNCIAKFRVDNTVIRSPVHNWTEPCLTHDYCANVYACTSVLPDLPCFCKCYHIGNQYYLGSWLLPWYWLIIQVIASVTTIISGMVVFVSGMFVVFTWCGWAPPEEKHVAFSV